MISCVDDGDHPDFATTATVQTSGAQNRCEVSMPFSGKSKCDRKKLLNSNYCFWHHPAEDKFRPETLSDYFGVGVTLALAIEQEIATKGSLENSFLQNAEFDGSLVKRGPNLSGGIFNNANLKGCSLSYSDLQDASFGGANLTKAKLSNCNLQGVNFYKTRLFEVKLRFNDLSSAIHLNKSNFKGFPNGPLPTYRILEDFPEQAEPMYRELVKYFSTRGLFMDASWAAYRASLLRHRLLRKRLSIRYILAERFTYKIAPGFVDQPSTPIIEWLQAVVSWLSSITSMLVIGYGEKPLRVIGTGFFIIIFYAILYSLPHGTTAGDVWSALYFIW